MQLGRCPVCHSRIALEQMVQDEAGRELLAMLARLDAESGAALVSYIGLFRSANRDLANDRALKLVKESIALAEHGVLVLALQETALSLHDKRARGEVKPLANHNYLKQVISSVAARGERYQIPHSKAGHDDYRTAAASIKRLKDTSW